MMNQIHAASLSMFLFLVPVLHAAEFGVVPDPYTGNWEGIMTAGTGEKGVHATAIKYKKQYEVTFRASPDPREKAIVIINGTVQEDKLILEPVLGPDLSDGAEGQTKTVQWNGVAKDNELNGTFTGRETGTFSLQKTPFQPSSTLGETAPSEATVLFDGADLQAWEPRKIPADPIQWTITDSGALKVVSQRDGKKNKQDLKTKELFGDYRLHLEFNLAYKPEAKGQGRSNSGIIHLGMYETQVLDSFGLYGHNNECGGIYKIREPDRNAGYPAGLWQTYDIEVKAPRFGAKGNKTTDARMTVRLNGILIHDDVIVPKPTAGGKEAARGPIVLQDHGSPVQFRNIWVVKFD
ncbi:3-keto-disaccharide hydrolase [Pontiella sulfatireligans]|uniref:3-keto-alpha-glucoside-1,2-lyase/3-keto-2-hydroxy-glucal hydratase domain-containing protein n=1 Tax=Pontiella sulfatireligans TaxID=2750658 RepID=A0A6C2UKD7_9BACT|nr:DUF1080 domain-containing protein [Pontiella sulfatireligans]VGO20702.1 hypothetical protein SCARR_02769 [Pontiella sulfatireligans]